MNVQQGTVNTAEEAKRIWDQLDAEDGGSPAAVLSEPTSQATEATDPAPVENHNADSTDAPRAGEEAAPSGEQVLLDRIAGMETMLSQLTQRLRNAEGHIGGLGSQLKQQLQAAQQVTAKGGDAPTAGEIRDAQRSPEAMARLKADYPEFAEAMESALNERLSTLEQRMAQQAQQAAPASSVTAEDIAKLRAEMAVEVRHPGWQGLVQEPVFQGWLKRQPREVQMLAASESPQDAIRLLDLYGDSGKSAATQRTQRLNAASAIPTGRSGASARQKSVDEMTPEEYWRYLDELDRQKR